MNRTYEAMVLLDNREVKRGWQALKDNVTGLFQKHGAEIVSAKRWEERRLAYPIKHQLRGTYLLVYCNTDSQSLDSIRRDLEYSEPVLRYLAFACDEVPENAFEPEAEFDEAAVRVEEESSPPPEEAPAEAAPKTEGGEEAKAEGAEGAEAKADEAKAEEAKPDEAKPEGAAAEEPKAETAEPATAEPATEAIPAPEASDAPAETESTDDKKEDN